MVAGFLSRALVATMLIVAAREVSAQEPLEPQAPTGDVSAQGPIANPADRLPPAKPTAVSQHLDFGIGLYQGFDRTLATDTRLTPLADARFYDDTALSSASGTLSYSRHSHDTDVGVAGGGNIRYYSVVPDMIPADMFGAASVSSKFTRRTRIRASGSASYSPYYSFGSFLQPNSGSTALLPPTTEQNIARLDTRTYNASGGLIWAPTRKTSVDFSYTGDLVDTAALAYRSFNQSVGAQMAHRMSRYATLRLGYAYRTSEFGAIGQRARMHDILAGFGYQRPLSFSRHTVVGFNVGTTIIDEPTTYTFILTGEGSLIHQLTRRWSTSVYYRRDTDAFAGALDLFVTDNISGLLAGAFSRKLTVSAYGGYSVGRLANGITNGYQATSGGGRVSYLVSRYVPIYGEYVFYHYDFQRGVGLAPGFPLLTTRHGVRAGLSYNVPLVGRRIR
jgi:putative beta-barrel porin BBP2